MSNQHDSFTWQGEAALCSMLRFHCEALLMCCCFLSDFLTPKARTVLSVEGWLLGSPQVLLASHVCVPKWPGQQWCPIGAPESTLPEPGKTQGRSVLCSWVAHSQCTPPSSAPPRASTSEAGEPQKVVAVPGEREGGSKELNTSLALGTQTVLTWDRDL